jgi:hypothetical protein
VCARAKRKALSGKRAFLVSAAERATHLLSWVGGGGGRAYVEFIKHEARFSSLRILRQFLKLCISETIVSCHPSDSPQIPLQSEDAGIEPCTVATVAWTAKRSNRSARSHLKLILISLVSSNELFVRLNDDDHITCTESLATVNGYVRAI